MPPTLEQVFTLRGFLSKETMLSFGSTKAGPNRCIATITHGTLEGSGLHAQILPGGGDWLLIDTKNGTAHLDVRAQARSEKGEFVYMHYPGILRMDEATQQAFEWCPEAKSTQSKDHYFFTTPIFETNSEHLKWMEQSVFLGHGHWHIPGDGTQAVEYEIYKVLSE